MNLAEITLIAEWCICSQTGEKNKLILFARETLDAEYLCLRYY